MNEPEEKVTDTPTTVMDWLIAKFPEAKKTTLRDMVSEKRVIVNGVAAKSLKQPLTDTDKVDVGEAGHREVNVAEGLKIVYQDADVIVVEKPVGLLTSTDAEELRPTAIKILNDYIQAYNQKATVKLIHRLDRDASGLLVFARTQTAYTKLKEQFAAHSVVRHYTVVVHGVFRNPKGRLENMLLEDERGIVSVVKSHPRARHAVMDYEVMKNTVRLTMVKCALHTGRKHQIRVQLKAAGHPICGDIVYGTPAAKLNQEPPGRLALHSTFLSFTHPKSNRPISFECPAPESFFKLMPI